MFNTQMVYMLLLAFCSSKLDEPRHRFLHKKVMRHLVRCYVVMGIAAKKNQKQVSCVDCYPMSVWRGPVSEPSPCPWFHDSPWIKGVSTTATITFQCRLGPPGGYVWLSNTWEMRRLLKMDEDLNCMVTGRLGEGAQGLLQPQVQCGSEGMGTRSHYNGRKSPKQANIPYGMAMKTEHKILLRTFQEYVQGELSTNKPGHIWSSYNLFMLYHQDRFEVVALAI